MATKSELISDIELRLTRGKPSDDFEIPQEQIAHWIDSVRDDIVAHKIAVDWKKGISPAPIYIKLEEALLASKTAGQVNNTGAGIRYDITITDPILDIDGDLGLVRVMRELGGELVNLYPNEEEVRLIQLLEFSKSKSDFSNLSGHREGQDVFIVGIDVGDIANEYYSAFFIEATPSKTLSDGDVYPLEGELVPLVLDEAEALGRRELGMVEWEDLDNDGVQTKVDNE